MYDNGPLSVRLAYNWRDDFLITTTAYQTSGAYDNWSNVPDTIERHLGQSVWQEHLLRSAGVLLSDRPRSTPT